MLTIRYLLYLQKGIGLKNRFSFFFIFTLFLFGSLQAKAEVEEYAAMEVSSALNEEGLAEDAPATEHTSSFMTPCSAATVPFSQDFEDITPPNLPECATLQTLAGNDWETDNVSDYGFNSNVLKYTYSTFASKINF